MGGELDEQLYEMTSASALLKENNKKTNLTVNVVICWKQVKM